MTSGSRLLNKAFLSIMIISAMSMFFGILCVIIDGIIIGRFLGTDATSAMGLVQPAAMVINVLGMLLGPGGVTVCSRYIGKAQPQRVSQVFSVLILAIIAVFSVFTLILFFAAPSVMSIVAPGGEAHILAMASDYLKAWALGIIPTRLCVAMMGLMMLDNDRKLAMLSLLVTLFSDVAFDLMNVTIFHGGMYGMALATTFSQILGVAVILLHFFRKERIIRFTLKGLRLSDLKDVISYGVTNAVTFSGQMIRTLCFNVFLLSLVGSGAVAAYYVANSVSSVLMMITSGILVAMSTMTSLLFGQKDANALVECTKYATKISMLVFALVSVIIFVLSRPLAGVFLKADSQTEIAMSSGLIRAIVIRFLIIALVLCIGGAYQGMGKLKLNAFITFMREAVLPVGCCVILGKLFGLTGFMLGFFAAGIFTVMLYFIITSVCNRRAPRSVGDMLLLPEGYGAGPEEVYETVIENMEDVMRASSEVMEFCKKRRVDGRDASRLALFVEEMSGNTVTHGFRGKAGELVELRLLCSEEDTMICFRDNGITFDPVKWLEINHPEDPVSGAGIRIVIGLASEVKYMPAMGLNQLEVRL